MRDQTLAAVRELSHRRGVSITVVRIAIHGDARLRDPLPRSADVRDGAVGAGARRRGGRDSPGPTRCDDRSDPRAPGGRTRHMWSRGTNSKAAEGPSPKGSLFERGLPQRRPAGERGRKAEQGERGEDEERRYTGPGV